MDSPIAKSTNPLLGSLDLDDVEKLLKFPIEKSFAPTPKKFSEGFDESLKDEILTFVDAWFWTNKELPSRALIVDRFNLSQVDYEMYITSFNEALKNRLGLELQLNPLPVRVDLGFPKLDPLFVMACNMICDVADKKTTAAKLKAVNLTTRQWQAMLVIPMHKEYFERRLESVFGENTKHAAKLAIARNVEAGDLPSIRYFHEFTGEFKPHQETTLNLAFLLGRVMEVLARFVSPEVMNQIANEIDTVLEVKELSA